MNRIRELRLKRGMSQTELAKNIGKMIDEVPALISMIGIDDFWDKYGKKVPIHE